jgi:hypothetical protein
MKDETMLRISLAAAMAAAFLSLAAQADAFSSIPVNGTSLDGISASVRAAMQREGDDNSAARIAIGSPTDEVSFI